MASLTHVKRAKKTYTCAKCGESIYPGSPAYRLQILHQTPRMYHEKCKPMPSEMTASENLSVLYKVREDLEAILAFSKPIDMPNILTAMDELIARVVDTAQKYRASADRMAGTNFKSWGKPTIALIEKAEKTERWATKLVEAKLIAEESQKEYAALKRKMHDVGQLLSNLEDDFANLNEFDESFPDSVEEARQHSKEKVDRARNSINGLKAKIDSTYNKDKERIEAALNSLEL